MKKASDKLRENIYKSCLKRLYPKYIKNSQNSITQKKPIHTR